MYSLYHHHIHVFGFKTVQKQKHTIFIQGYGWHCKQGYFMHVQ